MANVYVRSGAAGAGTGADWTNAYTTLAAALTAKAAGDDFWVSEDHAESTAGVVTLACPGTVSTPCRIVSVDHTGSTPPVAADLMAGGSITTTGANGIALTGFCYVYGLTFSAGTGAVAASITFGASTSDIKLDTCALRIVATSGSSNISAGLTSANASSSVSFENTTVSFGVSAQLMVLQGVRFSWTATASALAATVPAVLFKTSASNRAALATIEGVDLSAIGAGALVDANLAPANYLFRDCKVGTGTLVTVPTSTAGVQVDFVNCNNGALNNFWSRSRYQGLLTTDATVYRTGGSSDGTTPSSWKVVTTANNKRQAPFECFEIAQWVDTTGSHTATIHVCPTTGVTLTDAEVWADIFYLGSSGSPLASLLSTAPATILTAGSNLSASGASWTGSGLGTAQSIVSASFTTNMKGLVRARVYITKASATVYVDPRLDIS